MGDAALIAHLAGFGIWNERVPLNVTAVHATIALLSCARVAAIAGGARSIRGIFMSVPMVLLPVFVLVGLTFALLIWMFWARRNAIVSRETKVRDIVLGQQNWPVRTTQIGNCFRNQFELPVLFYILIAIALPLRHADLVIVWLSWAFVVTRLVHAGIFVTSNDLNRRSLAFAAGALVLLVMWIYFALRILLLI
jgi:hypothetical protein